MHTDSEELGMFKEHRNELDFCVMADCVVAVGPKSAEVYRTYLRFCGKDQNFALLPPPLSKKDIPSSAL